MKNREPHLTAWRKVGRRNSSQYSAFVDELEALCIKHDVTLRSCDEHPVELQVFDRTDQETFLGWLEFQAEPTGD